MTSRAFSVLFAASAVLPSLAQTSAGAGSVASVSAASYALNAPSAPNMIASAFGHGLAGSPASGSFPLPTTLANVALSVTDSAGTTRAAQLYYAGPAQINYVIPNGTADGAATVTVTEGAQTLATGAIQVAAVAPGLFTANYDGRGAAAGVALRYPAAGGEILQYLAACGAAAGTCVTAPIDLGAAGDLVLITLYGTGIRGYKTGITAAIGGVAAIPSSTIPVPTQYPGLDQVTLPLSRSLIGSGEVDVVLTVDGVAANTVTINVM
jgi:uncharacterized protein (TIGR03437 family)